ncbi:MAG: TIGR04283 family arsenosugar biosynthesis glycosyltransferase [Gammaproteobacteria bacterium]
MPVLNEAATLRSALRALQPLRLAGHEVIIIDGGSSDDSAALAADYADRVIHSAPGRARQMNAGAQAANGNILLFLHADTLLPRDALQAISAGLKRSGNCWGRFDVRLAGRPWPLRLVEAMMNLRSRLSGIATGDQAIFVRRSAFEKIGGYPPIDLMEDIAISKDLKRISPPLCLRQQVISSSRRWERNGILSTILLMWRLRLAYFLGADPAQLARRYYHP